MTTLASPETSSESTTRNNYLEQVSKDVYSLQALYAKLSRMRTETPEGFRQRIQVAERIQTLLSSVTPDEQKEYGIW